jgi:hypothetical protein
MERFLREWCNAVYYCCTTYNHAIAKYQIDQINFALGLPKDTQYDVRFFNDQMIVKNDKVELQYWKESGRVSIKNQQSSQIG